ncbi:TIM barrel protein [Candidatus Poribacteria bacterium]|nr:TIM barrel protein [Candidatus Poribacteria bacterium]
MMTSLFSQSLFALSLMEAIDATARAGYNAIELACAGPHLNYQVAKESSEEVAQSIFDAGLKVSALSLFNNFTDPEGLEGHIDRAKYYINLAHIFQTDILKLTPGPPAFANANEKHWAAIKRALDQLIPEAEKSGVKLAFETHMRQLTDTVEGSLRLLEIADSPVVGLTVDFSNLRFSGEDMNEAFNALGDKMYNTHLKNGTLGEDGSWHFKALDDGLTDYDEVFGLLRGIGYKGYLTIECLSSDTKVEPFETVKRDLEILKGYIKGR